MKKRVLIRLENVILNLAFFEINDRNKYFLETPYRYTNQGGSILQTSSYYSANVEQSILVNTLAGNSTEARQRVHKRLLINPYSGITESIRKILNEGITVGIVSEYGDDFCNYFLKMLELLEVKIYYNVKNGELTNIVEGQYDVIISSECIDLDNIDDRIEKIYASWGSQKYIEPTCHVDAIATKSWKLYEEIFVNIKGKNSYDMFCEHTEEWIKEYICKYYANIDKRRAKHIWNPLIRYMRLDISNIRSSRYYIPRVNLEPLSRQELFNLWNQIINYENHMSSVSENMPLSSAGYGSHWTVLEMAIMQQYLYKETFILLTKILPGRTRVAIVSKAIDYGLGKRVPKEWRRLW